MRNWLSLLAVICLLLLAPIPSLHAQTDAPAAQPPDTSADIDIPVATVTLDRRPLFVVRGSSSIPATERAHAIGERILSGSLAALEPGSFRVLLGGEVATRLGVTTGDTVVMAIAQGTVTPAGVVPRMRRFTVAGVFFSGMYEIDNGLALVNLVDAARLFRTGADATGLRLRVSDPLRAPSVARAVAGALGGGLYVEDWTQRHANFFRSIELTKRMMFFILVLVVAVGAFNIVSTLVMAVKDKQPDIAILRTLGARPASVLAVFATQGTVIGLLGTVAGVVLGVLLAADLESLVHGLERLVGTAFMGASV